MNKRALLLTVALAWTLLAGKAQAQAPVFCVFEISPPERWIGTTTIRVQNTGTGVAYGLTLRYVGGGAYPGAAPVEIPSGTLARLGPGEVGDFKLATGEVIYLGSWRVTYQACQPQ